ncbi:cation diffusion facilitator family transporter [Geodermatophilus ruber]|uniref:Cation diffusion facilitator family transporter n=1 Tax=Geodermatophilus ruber TaxID=504800 RepID=A0A1I3ZBV4_9ACTN|nr:cation diffusion facilitator family transporter [Geodermatophilus ruber]SFK41066.1 cation diffusion facilitator family transporter [Geodermatophilus ruber]
MTMPGAPSERSVVTPGPPAPPVQGDVGGPEHGSGGESTATVVVAGIANLGIAIAKLIGGLISHSSAMLSEAAHSLADTITEVLLFVALKRGNRPADDKHPFGYGRETYFWAFLAALATFTLGAGFSIWQGIATIVGGEEQGDPRISYVVLAVSFVLEGLSWLKAVRQVRGAARRLRVSPGRYLATTTDTTVKAVTFEDSAALIGLVLAALGLFLEHLTGDPLWDGLAAVTIGVLLLGVAYALARANASLLIGQAASPQIEEELRREIAALPHVEDVPLLVTSVIGPGQLVVAAKVDFADDATSTDIERTADEAERRLVARHPGVRYVFLDPTGTSGKSRTHKE